MRLARAISRRRFLAGAGTAAASACLARATRAQPAPDGVRVIRALNAGYDGTIPGPTLRLKQGEELAVRLINELDEHAAIHWHGVRLINAMDGVPSLTQPPVLPGASFDYRLRPPDAGTFWYRGYAAPQIDRGLYGALIVEEPEPVAVDREILLVLGMPRDNDSAPLHVNGAVRPDFQVARGERLRLRLINATAARGVVLKLDGHAPWVMALDGQPAEPFLARDARVGLAPGGRADLFVDMNGDAGTITPILAGNEPIARLVYDQANNLRSPPRADPAALPPNPLPARIDLKGSLRVELSLDTLRLAARPLDPAGPPLFTVRRGRAVTLALRNPLAQPQVLHLHGHSFRLLDRLDDGWKPYWLDTLVVGTETERIAFVADNPGKWLIDFRALEQPQSNPWGAAVWFAVT
jgi:FtsP/CotA-like multicopper oxidase with cupredoxin domain